MSGLREVLRGHRDMTLWQLEAAVLAWLRDQLGSEGVREAVAEAARTEWCGIDNPTPWADLSRSVHMAWVAQADAALTAVVGALGVEGEAGLGSRERGIGHESDPGAQSGLGDHRNDEGRSGARDGGMA